MLRQLILTTILTPAIPVAGLGQETDPIEGMQVLLNEANSKKIEIAREPMPLGEADAKIFRPIYDANRKEIQSSDDRMLEPGFASALPAKFRS